MVVAVSRKPDVFIVIILLVVAVVLHPHLLAYVWVAHDRLTRAGDLKTSTWIPLEQCKKFMGITYFCDFFWKRCVSLKIFWDPADPTEPE